MEARITAKAWRITESKSNGEATRGEETKSNGIAQPGLDSQWKSKAKNWKAKRNATKTVSNQVR